MLRFIKDLNMLNNRTLAIIAGVIVVGAILHIEYRISTLSDKVDTITNIITTNETIKHTPADRECLIKNIYYEAGVEDIKGKYAVAHVTVNRMKTGRWGDNLCKVVYAPKQFSWTLKKKLHKPDPTVWAESRAVAINVLNGARVKGLEQSLFYHADYIRPPKWADMTQFVVQIGQHIFYNKAKTSGGYI